MKVTYVKNPKSQPPDPDKPYVCFAGPDAKEQWLELATDAGDGVTDADFDFDFEGTKAKLERGELWWHCTTPHLAGHRGHGALLACVGSPGSPS